MYATAIDYNPKDSKSIEFFKIVQNKLHYAAHGHTAPEVIYERADSDKPFMGLTTFSGDLPIMSDVVIAKNYLTEEELQKEIYAVSEKVYKAAAEAQQAAGNQADANAQPDDNVYEADFTDVDENK